MKYEEFREDQQEELLKNRLRQFEAEHYNHKLNLELLEEQNDGSEETKKLIEQTKAAMDTIENAHTAVKARLNAPKTTRKSKSS